MTALAAPSRSNSPMTATSEVSLKMAMKVLTSAGMVTRSACGSTIRIVAGQNGRPMLAAASYCPFGMACSPARTTSAR